MDIFEDNAALQEVRDFILLHTTKILGEQPQLYPVSAKLAQRAQSKRTPNNATGLRSASRLDDLEQFINAPSTTPHGSSSNSTIRWA